MFKGGRKYACRNKRIYSLLLVAAFFSSFRFSAFAANTGKLPDEEAVLKKKTEQLLSGMTLEEKVAQLFIVTPETLTGVSVATIAGAQTEASFSEYPVGGLIYMEQNICSWDQTQQMLSDMQEISMRRLGIPIFLAVDVEGGTVRRISARLEQTPYITDMASIGSTQNSHLAYETGFSIGTYLNQLNFNVDFAPVADVLTNPENTVIGNRSFGSDPQVVAKMVSEEVKGLQDAGICATLKHFPGHGNTSEDSHSGIAISDKTLSELEECELLPFQSGIREGAGLVMTGHIAFPNILGNMVPATLSRYMLTDVLRNQLGFEGITVTDALKMGAIVDTYGTGIAAVEAFLAGADMLLEPDDFPAAYNSVLDAVRNGTISEARLQESLERIIQQKIIIAENGQES